MECSAGVLSSQDCVDVDERAALLLIFVACPIFSSSQVGLTLRPEKQQFEAMYGLRKLKFKN